jgi:hypothetical protein
VASGGQDDEPEPPVVTYAQHLSRVGGDAGATGKSNAEKENERLAKKAKREAKQLAKQEKEREKRLAEEEAMANRRETKEEREKREKQNAEVVAKLFKLEQQSGAERLLKLWRPLILLNSVVVVSNTLMLVYTFTQRTANDEPAGVDAAGELVYYPARSWSPFSGAMWALLSAFGSTLSSANMLQIRIYLGLQGTAFNPGIAKVSIYLFYFSVWCQFQALVSHMYRIDENLTRMSDTIIVAAEVVDNVGPDGTEYPSKMAPGIINTAFAIMVVPVQTSIQVSSYTTMYKGLAPLVGPKQLESHFRNSVQLALLSNSLFLGIYLVNYLSDITSLIEMPTFYETLYLAAFAFNALIVGVQVFYSQVNRQLDNVDEMRTSMQDKQTQLEDSLDVDFKVGAEIRFKDMTGAKAKLNGCLAQVEKTELEGKANPNLVLVLVLGDDQIPANYEGPDGEFKVPAQLVGQKLEVDRKFFEPDDSAAGRKSKEAQVDLEKLALEDELETANAKLETNLYRYVVVAQCMVAAILSYLILLFNSSRAAGISMFMEMIPQAIQEQVDAGTRKSLGPAGSGYPLPEPRPGVDPEKAAQKIQTMICNYWSGCGLSVYESTPRCGPGICAIPDARMSTAIVWSDVEIMCIIAGVLSGIVAGMLFYTAFRSIGMKMNRSCIAAVFIMGVSGVFAAVFAFYAMAIEGPEFDCTDQRIGNPLDDDGSPSSAANPDTEPLSIQCITSGSGNYINQVYMKGASGSIMGNMLGLCFYLVQSFMLLGSRIQSEDPNGFAMYQLTFYSVYNLFMCAIWFLIQMGLSTTGVWANMVEIVAKTARQEETLLYRYGPLFPLAPPDYLETNRTMLGVLRAQKRINFLWNDFSSMLLIVIPMALVQTAGLAIIYLGGIKYVGLLKYVMYAQVLVSATLVFEMYLLNEVVSVDGLALTTFIAPSLFFQLITTFYAWQSDIMIEGGASGKLSTMQGRASLLIYFSYAAILYMFSVGMAMTIGSLYDPLLGNAEIGITLVIVSGLCLGSVAVFGIGMLVRFCLTRILAEMNG